MPPKHTKITDVASPGKTAPSVTSRPIVVTNRSLIANDPMIVDASKRSEPSEATAMMHRTAKTIEPMNVQSEVPGPSAQQVTAPLEPTAPTVPAENAEQTEVVSVLEPPKLAKVSTEAEPTGVTESSPTPMEDDAVPPVPADDSSKSFATAQEPKPTATANESTAPESDANDESKAAAAEAQAKMDADARTRKLEQLVASGTYAVPINAVRRKRSRTFVATMCVLALVLATLLLDVLLDVGIVDLPFSVPHTRLFSDI